MKKVRSVFIGGLVILLSLFGIVGFCGATPFTATATVQGKVTVVTVAHSDTIDWNWLEVGELMTFSYTFNHYDYDYDTFAWSVQGSNWSGSGYNMGSGTLYAQYIEDDNSIAAGGYMDEYMLWSGSKMIPTSTNYYSNRWDGSYGFTINLDTNAVTGYESCNSSFYPLLPDFEFLNGGTYFAFEAPADPAPEPATLTLFGVGIMALFGAGVKKNAYQDI